MTLKDTLFSSDELNRYSRHFSLEEIGIAGQQKLKEARVLCVGAGGLGSPLCLYLAAAGVGTIGIIDGDFVEASNLQRQVLYSEDQIGQAKVLAAKERLLKLNPHIHIETYQEALSVDNALSIIKDYDLVADGSDNFSTRFLVNDACFHLKKANIYASISQFNAQLSVFTKDSGPCYRCLYPNIPPADLIPSCAEAGVLGVLPGIMGSLQALEVLKLILTIGDAMVGRLLCFDALAMHFKELKITRDPECVLCSQQLPFRELQRPENLCTTLNEDISVEALWALRNKKADFILLDVRENHEYDICNISGELIPLNTLESCIHNLDKNKFIVVHCKSGGRSAKAALLLKNHGFKNVANLKGGILEWIEKIDPQLKKY